MVDYRIVEDIGNGVYSSNTYHKGRKYIILFDKLPFECGAKIFEFEEFEALCKDFLKKYERTNKEE